MITVRSQKRVYVENFPSCGIRTGHPGNCIYLCPIHFQSEISGQVQDPSGSSIPAATVAATSSETSLRRTAQTNESGNFVIPNLPIGRYTIATEAQGFKRSVLADVQLSTNQKLGLSIRLEVGNITEAITVAAEAAQVETTTGEVRRVVTSEQATQLQLNGRNFPQLLALLPGVSTTYSSGFGLFGGYGVNNSGQSANGGRTDSFSWNLNGADNKDNGGGGNNFIKSIPTHYPNLRSSQPITAHSTDIAPARSST